MLSCVVTRYTVSVTSNLEASSNGGSRPWVGYPSHDSLRVVQTQAKTPSLVHSFYGIPGSPVACETDNIQAIGVLQSTSSGFYSNDDLSTFYDHNDISTSEVGLVQFVGSIDPSSALQARLAELGLVLADDPVVNIQNEPGDETTYATYALRHCIRVGGMSALRSPRWVAFVLDPQAGCRVDFRHSAWCPDPGVPRWLLPDQLAVWHRPHDVGGARYPVRFPAWLRSLFAAHASHGRFTRVCLLPCWSCVLCRCRSGTRVRRRWCCP